MIIEIFEEQLKDDVQLYHAWYIYAYLDYEHIFRSSSVPKFRTLKKASAFFDDISR
jgi:hypothetical protein